MKYDKLADMVKAAQAGTLSKGVRVVIDNDCISANDDNLLDENGEPIEVWRSKEGIPRYELEALLNDLGVHAHQC